MAVVTTDRLVRTFIAIRDRRKELKATYEKENSELAQKQRRVENELLRRAKDEEVEGFKTASGTTYQTEVKHVSIADQDDFNAFVKKSGDLYFYEQRPSLGHIVEYQNAHDGKLPPGIRMFREFRMRVATRKKRRGVRHESTASDD